MDEAVTPADGGVWAWSLYGDSEGRWFLIANPRALAPPPALVMRLSDAVDADYARARTTTLSCLGPPHVPLARLAARLAAGGVAARWHVLAALVGSAASAVERYCDQGGTPPHAEGWDGLAAFTLAWGWCRHPLTAALNARAPLEAAQ